MDRFENECLLYFRSEKIWARIFKAFRKKYISYGYFTGTVKITGLSLEDVEVLEGFFGKNFHGKKSASISAVSFDQALSLSRFRDISVEHLLELYFGEPVQGKKQQEAANSQKNNNSNNNSN